jgi:hypothetical protein
LFSLDLGCSFGNWTVIGTVIVAKYTLNTFFIGCCQVDNWLYSANMFISRTNFIVDGYTWVIHIIHLQWNKVVDNCEKIAHMQGKFCKLRYTRNLSTVSLIINNLDNTQVIPYISLRPFIYIYLYINGSFEELSDL